MSEQYPGGFITKSPVLPDGTTASGIWNLSQQAEYQAAGTWPAYPVPDQYFNYVTALFHGDGTNGAAYGGGNASSSVTPYNTDASGNAVVVTPVNSTQANRTNPYQAGYYSNYFGGSDYFTLPDSSAWSQAGDYTIECWYNPQDFSGAGANRNLVGYSSASSTIWILQVDTSGNPFFRWYNTSVTAYSITSSTAMVLKTWNHIAVTFSGTTVTLWLNGVSVGTTTISGSVRTASSCGLGIGSWGLSTSDPHPVGYMSNVRIVKGTAVYTSSFTPPTSPLTAITNTQLLACQANRFIDSSTNAYTITASGTPSVTAYQPFTLSTSYATYGSASFPGSSYWTAPATSNVAFGTGDFTIEAWIYPTSTTSYRNIFSSRGTDSTSVWFGLDTGTLTPTLFTNVSVVASSIAVKLNAWSHVALVRISGTTTIYVNGVSGGSASNTTNYAGTVCNMDPSYAFAGFVTDLRIVKGTGVYTTTFTPPTSPLTAVTGTSLLTFQYNGGNNNTGFIDSSQNNFAVTRYSSGSIANTSSLGPNSGAFGPYGSNWSNYFATATSDYLKNTGGITVGSGNFTVECWSNNPAGGYFLCLGDDSLATGISFRVYANGNINFFTNGSANVFTATAAVNTWNHFAFVRNSGTLTCYLNGVSVGTASLSANISGAVTVAGELYSGVYYPAMTGYISNLRVTNTAVYNSNFTPSTSPLTAVSGTLLLTCQSNRFVDNSVSALTWTLNGTPSVQAFNPFGQSTAYNPAVNGASAYFSGGTYLTNGTNTWNSLEVANNAALRFGTTSNFTIEMWAYLGSGQSSILIADEVVDEGTGNNTGWYVYVGSDRTVNFGATGTNYITAPYIPAFNSWFHFALVRNSGTTTMYINGVSSGSTSSTINMSAATDVRSDTPWLIGCLEHYYWSGCLGYISDVRVTNTAVYTSSFTPNTTPLTATNGTQLLLNMNANGIYDNAEINNLTTVVNAQVSTSVKKYGTGSLYFDGSSAITTPTNLDAAFGSGDFTIECWLYLNTVSGIQLVFDGRPSNGAYPAIYMNGAAVTYYVSTADRIVGSSLSTSTWYHIAVCRSGTSTKMFVNGTQAGSTYTDSTVYLSGPVRLGSDYTPSQYLNGYIDDLRVTKGIARYTTTFTPPTRAFPNYGPN